MSKIIKLPYYLSHFINKNPLFGIDLFLGPLRWNCPNMHSGWVSRGRIRGCGCCRCFDCGCDRGFDCCYCPHTSIDLVVSRMRDFYTLNVSGRKGYKFDDIISTLKCSICKNWRVVWKEKFTKLWTSCTLGCPIESYTSPTHFILSKI